MNKIYKVIWSKARHQYVVASELAKSVTKGAGSRIGRTAAAVLAAIVLTAGTAVVPAQAKEVNIPVYGLADITHNGNAHLSTESVQEVLNGETLNLGGLTINNSNVLTEAAMDGYVQWDSGTTDKIGGVQFTGNGGLSGTSLLTQSTLGGQNYSVKIENGAITTTGNAQSSIGGVTLRNGVVSHLTAGTNDMDAVNVKQMKDADTATLNSAKSYTDGQMDGVVKWDPVLDEDGQPTGEYNKDSIHGVELKDGTIHATGGGDNSINGTLTVGGYTTINADARVQGQMTAAGYHNANDTFTVDENGNLKAAGGIVSGTTQGSGIAIGSDSSANDRALAIGLGAASYAESTAIGTYAKADSNYSVALGQHAVAGKDESVAVGYYAAASGEKSTALGRGAKATAENSVALGAWSETGDRANTVSVGSEGAERQITNVAAGTEATDAVNVGQLRTAVFDATEGMVKWDTATDADDNTAYTEGVLHGLKLEGNTDGTSTFSTISQVNGSSKITLNKDSIKVQADENRADAGELQLTASGALLESGNNGVMVGANGITLGNSQTGGTLEMANDGTATFHAQDKNGTTAISGDELSTGSISASDGNFVTSGTGTVIQNGEGESLQFDSNGLLIKSEGTQGNGTIFMNDGALHLQNGNADDTTYVDISTTGTTFSHNGDDKTTISGGTITTGTVTGLTNTDWNGTTDNETRAATEGQLADLSATVTENAKNVVKWDNDDQNTIKGVEYQGDGNLKVNDLTAGTLNAADGAVKVDEEGNFSAGNGLFTVSDTGAVSAGMTDGPSFALNESGVHMDAGNGSKLDVTAGGTTFTGADGKQTYINGNEINTGTVLAQEMYVGSKADENTVVTKGQLGTAVDEATEGMVQWDSTTDEEGNPTYQEGSLKGVQFTGEGDLTVADLTADTLNAADGNFKVDADGSITALTDQSAFILNDSMASLVSNSNRLSITTEGILLNAGDGSSTVTVNRTGTTFTTAQGSTSINGGQVIAGDTMYVHGSATEDNEVATKGDLSTAIGEATDGMVKWDNENENSINGVGLEDGKITAENGGNIGGVEFDGEGNLSTEGSITGGTITATGDLVIGTGENAVNVGEKLDELDTSISGVTGDVSDIKGQIGADAEGNLGLKNEGSTLVEGINKNTEAIENNTSSINGIKDQIGAVGEEGSLGLTNGESTLVGGINTNTSSINTIKNQIGGTGENGALNLANGQTTIESGINYNYAAIQQQGQAINALGGRVHELGEEIDSVGAISSALAGLHPLDYDGTGSKFQLSAAMGTYDGTQAAAIGGFYHFNEDVMLSLGGATAFNGEHKTAANIGVTFRVGPGGSEKKPATPDEVMATLDAMNRKIQEMDAKIAALEQDKKDLTEENQQLKAEAAEAVTAEAPAAEEQA